jgi:hypothetical protein
MQGSLYSHADQILKPFFKKTLLCFIPAVYIVNESVTWTYNIHQWSISIVFRFEVLALTTSWSVSTRVTRLYLEYTIRGWAKLLYIRMPMRIYHMITLTKRINKALNNSKLYLNTLNSYSSVLLDFRRIWREV